MSTPLLFFRWVSSNRELIQFELERCIQTTNQSARGTYYTSQRYASLAEAEARLALPASPLHVVGPIPADEMPPFDVIAHQRVQPGYGHPGGGIEFCTSSRVYVFGWYDYVNKR